MTPGTASREAQDATAFPPGDLVALEHINTWVPDIGMAMTFYLSGMGFTRDPYFHVGPENMWVNVGMQQFHLPTRGTQVIPGHVGITVPNIASLVRRLESVGAKLSGTRFAFHRDGETLVVISPWGNHFHCREADGSPGRRQLGIPYVEFTVREGAGEAIARFYRDALAAPVAVRQEGGHALVRVGIGTDQWLTFRETAEPLPAFDGHHIAVYVKDFARTLAAFQARGLVSSRTEIEPHQFRFHAIVDPATGEKVHDLEHEVRGTGHPLFRRTLINRDPDITPRNYMP